MSAARLICLLGLVWVAVPYVLYPMLLACLPRHRRAVSPPAGVEPSITVIVAVRNGARNLEQKLVDTFALDAPGPLQVIVASDASEDETDAIARRWSERGVELVRLRERGGKEAAQAAAIARARGDILVFSDVTARLLPGGLRALVAPFSDPAVHAVSSEDDVSSGGGEGAYVRFEMSLRRLESRATTLVGLSGSCFAIRRSLADPWPADLASDFRSALEAIRRGGRAVNASEARVSFGVAHDNSREWQRKVRTIRRGIAVLGEYRELLHPRWGRAAVSLWGHKVARFTSPFALVGVIVVTAWGAATGDGVLATAFVLQAIAYAIAAFGLLSPRAATLLPVRLASFFVLVNAATLLAWAYHVRGQRVVVWTPTER